LYDVFLGTFFGFASTQATDAAITAAAAAPSDSMEVIPKAEGDVGGQVKPITTQSPTDARPPNAIRMFLGNDSMYILFRYLQVLLDRLTQAKEFARRPSPLHQGTPAEEAVKQILGENKPDPLNPIPATTNADAKVKTEVSEAATTNLTSGDAVMSDEAKTTTQSAQPEEILFDDETTNSTYMNLTVSQAKTDRWIKQGGIMNSF